MVRGWNLEDLIRGCQVRMDRSSLAWVEARSGSCGRETGRRRFKIWIIKIFEVLNFDFFVGGTPVELRSGETSTRRRLIECVGDGQNVE